MEARLASDGALVELAKRQVLEPAPRPELPTAEHVWEEPPKVEQQKNEQSVAERYRYGQTVRKGIDYLAMEANNQSLGRAGEEFVLSLEAQRLHAEGRKALADRVEHVAASRGDGLGYDILSFEANGRERLIEVKTTSFGKRTPFYVSRNELACSAERHSEYHLYRLFAFRKAPRLFSLTGHLATVCRLDATHFIARVA